MSSRTSAGKSREVCSREVGHVGGLGAVGSLFDLLHTSLTALRAVSIVSLGLSPCRQLPMRYHLPCRSDMPCRSPQAQASLPYRAKTGLHHSANQLSASRTLR